MTALAELRTPCLLLDRAAFDHNVATMSAERPADRLRPHVKAFKSTAMAAELRAAGHHRFCCATLAEVEGMIAAGHDSDLLLANETLDVERLAAINRRAAITVAVDSSETIAVAAEAGTAAVLIDVNVGLPRCGCDPDDAERLAREARAAGLEVRGVMGYEGHLMDWPDRERQHRAVDRSMAQLAQAHTDVGGGLTSAGGTGTYDVHSGTDEVQAGSYLMMDSHYARVGLPFRQAAFVMATVISVHRGDDDWFVVDAGLKAFGMDHGNPALAPFGPQGTVFIVSDEHITVLADGNELPDLGDRVFFVPGHIDPTVAKHDCYQVVDALPAETSTASDVTATVMAEWPIDLRGW